MGAQSRAEVQPVSVAAGVLVTPVFINGGHEWRDFP